MLNIFLPTELQIEHFISNPKPAINIFVEKLAQSSNNTIPRQNTEKQSENNMKTLLNLFMIF